MEVTMPLKLRHDQRCLIYIGPRSTMYLTSSTGLRFRSKNTHWINSRKPTVLIKKLCGQCIMSLPTFWHSFLAQIVRQLILIVNSIHINVFRYHDSTHSFAALATQTALLSHSESALFDVDHPSRMGTVGTEMVFSKLNSEQLRQERSRIGVQSWQEDGNP